MRLYHSPMSIALACRLALTAADIDHEVVIVSSLSGETKQAPFLSINPLGEVPTLDVDGAIVTQTVAILNFIADLGGQGWVDAAPIARAKELSTMIVAAVEVQSAWKMINRPNRYAPSDAAAAEVGAQARIRLDAAYTELERRIGLRDTSSPLTVLDYYAGVLALWKIMAPAGKGLSPTPHLDAVKDRLMNTPKLRQVIDEDIASYTAMMG
ncbi:MULTISPECIES: glutathione S-transferase family protein [unclassified Sphingomonas]|nr:MULTISPECIES: glutathione S-transferase family protein [unclassified Sphingomonas]KQX19648.1 glutathione S-transferase [Sphingomonas sp. Root1294]KQY65849.1 glutathione S-transferase [Sphingomonas sp. Root50]KRB94844.1 glutathione S-transferase [Sphingomonas sp. Root720]